MSKFIKSHQLIPLLHSYINLIKKGKQLQKNGKRIKLGSIRNYYFLEFLLLKFSHQKSFPLELVVFTKFNKSIYKSQAKYWNEFYFQFTSFLYNELNYHDNTVGRNIKLLRCFFGYLINEKGMNIGLYYKKFYAPYEESEIFVLSTDRLNDLIHDKEKELKLNAKQLLVKDIFVFGCAVALRFSDLISLTIANIENNGENKYIKVQSQKTRTFTKVKLPKYALAILTKYLKANSKCIFPRIDKSIMNQEIKKIMEIYLYTEEVIRIRHKRGIPVQLYKNVTYKTPFRFCDVISTHTMRRTAITTMLSNGMNEQMVRQISGHSAGSKEFYRYVAFAQSYLDQEIDMVHQKFDKNIEI